MVLVVSKEFSASVAGHKLEAVTCEKCATQFYYDLTRVGVGAEAAPYLMFQGWAAKRAAKLAQKDLTNA